jgi:hypothetical protein
MGVFPLVRADGNIAAIQTPANEDQVFESGLTLARSESRPPISFGRIPKPSVRIAGNIGESWTNVGRSPRFALVNHGAQALAARGVFT